jgi:dihydropteroate synthase
LKFLLNSRIGFAKTGSQNFDIIKKLGRINGSSSPLRGFPLLSGPSRKGFIGKATGKEVPKDRVFGTAAAVTASVLNGCNIVRIHDVAQMVDVVKVADQCKE